MTSDYEPNKHRDSVLQLVGQQIPYLKHGKAGTQSGSKLRETIKLKKFNRLVYRIQFLIEDLVYLRDADFISGEEWAELWESPLTQEERQRLMRQVANSRAFYDERGPEEWEEPVEEIDLELLEKLESPPENHFENLYLSNEFYERPIVKNTNGVEEFQFEFGIQLGHIARLLANESTSEFNQIAFASGFLLGLDGQGLRVPLEKNQEQKLILEWPSDETTEAIEFAQNSLLESVAWAPSSWDRKDAKERLEKAGLHPYTILVDELLNRVGDTEHPLGDYYLEREATNLASDEAILRAEEMREVIVREIEKLTEHTERGKNPPSAIEVLAATSTIVSGNKTNVKEVIDSHRSDAPDQQLISSLYHDIEGIGTKSEPWEDHPLVSGNVGMTSFGKLVGLILAPESVAREDDTYLPGDSTEKELFVVPSEEEVLVACYACALGRAGQKVKELFDEAYDNRMVEKEE